MSDKDEALKNVIKDLKDKLRSFETDASYYQRKLKEHELLIISHKELIAHLESTTNWSLSALQMNNGGVGNVCMAKDVHAVNRPLWKRLLRVK